MKRKKKNNNLNNFLFYLIIIFSLSTILILHLTIKNLHIITKEQIEDLERSTTQVTSIVKQLQSKKEKYLGEEHITNILKNKMKVATPETTIIWMGTNE